MITGYDRAGLVMICMLVTFACSTGSSSVQHAETVRKHADQAFQPLDTDRDAQQSGSFQPSSQPTPAIEGSNGGAAVHQRVQVPLAEIGSSDNEYIRATGYGDLSKGLYLCQHSADLAARVELSKLVGVRVKETSVDRIRERTGKAAEQDIEVVREGTINEVLREVRIIDRSANKEAGTCSSTAVIPKRNLLPTSDSTGSPLH